MLKVLDLTHHLVCFYFRTRTQRERKLLRSRIERRPAPWCPQVRKSGYRKVQNSTLQFVLLAYVWVFGNGEFSRRCLLKLDAVIPACLFHESVAKESSSSVKKYRRLGQGHERLHLSQGRGRQLLELRVFVLI